MRLTVVAVRNSRYTTRMADTIGENLNVIQTAIGHLAAETLTKVGKSGYGCVISPATWAYNYKTQGSTPTSVDVGYWGVSLAGGIFGPVALTASYLKALVDDDVARKLAAVRASEPARCRPGILALAGWGPPSSLAAEFAATGGVAWQNPNGLWVSVIDAQKRLVPDYRPFKFQAIVRPVLPLKTVPGGKGFMTTDKWSH